MRYEVEKWIRQEWGRQTRYYLIEIRQDIFGQWYCFRQWSCLTHKGGRSMTQNYDSYSDATDALDKLQVQRMKRGYQLSAEMI